MRGSIAEHPRRRQLMNEVHSRPPEIVQAPAEASHIALLSGERAQKAERSALLELCSHFQVTPPPLGSHFFQGEFGPIRMRWERHTEFSSYTFYRTGEFEEPFRNPPISEVPDDLLGQLPGELMVATHLAFEKHRPYSPGFPPTDFDRVIGLFGCDALGGAYVSSGQAEAFTDFNSCEDGFTRILVHDRGLGPRQAGRLMRRLLEIETYRTMALLGFPLARDMGPKVTEADRRLADVMARIREVDHEGEERELLAELSTLAAEIESWSASTNYRFGATAAYHNLVQKRLSEIRERRIEGLPMMQEFIDRRLSPAVATCVSVQERLESLSVRVSRAGQLLRTRVDLTLQEQNQQLLGSMDRRASLQLRLQETVEGLSVAAISYYAASLLGYLAKAAKSAGLVKLDPSLVTGISIPVIAGAVWFGMRRVKKKIEKAVEATEPVPLVTTLSGGEGPGSGEAGGDSEAADCACPHCDGNHGPESKTGSKTGSK